MTIVGFIVARFVVDVQQSNEFRTTEKQIFEIETVRQFSPDVVGIFVHRADVPLHPTVCI
jgi:hypothetical protein